MSKIIAIANQKGGVGKTTTCLNLGIGLAKEGKRVLLIDADAQGNLTSALGITQPDDLEHSLATLILDVIEEKEPKVPKTLCHHKEGVDFLPGNVLLASLEISLVNAISRETVIKRMLDPISESYDYILIDCQPSLGILTVNALVAADSVLIPVQAHYFSMQGLQELFKTIGKARRTLNRNLQIEGILFTFMQKTRFNSEIVQAITSAYEEQIPFFTQKIPQSIRAAETSAEGHSIFVHDPKGKIAEAYQQVVEEVLQHG